MKVGDTVPVTIEGHVVAQATVSELGDGTATLVIPSTRATFGVRTSLGDLPTEEPTTQTIVDEVVRADAVAPVTPVPATEVATAVEVKPDVVTAPVAVETPAPVEETSATE